MKKESRIPNYSYRYWFQAKTNLSKKKKEKLLNVSDNTNVPEHYLKKLILLCVTYIVVVGV